MLVASIDGKEMNSRPLSVEIPATYPSSSVESSLAPSPTGILDSQSTSASSSSLPVHSLNVTFAPLPKLAPRKRHSTAPLGMAARSQLIRRRQGYIDGAQNYHGPNPMWTDEELSRQQGLPRSPTERNGGEEDEICDDPLLVLGKMVKVASKRVWRKVSHRDIQKDKEKEVKDESEKRVKSPASGPESNKKLESQSQSAAEGVPPKHEPLHASTAVKPDVGDQPSLIEGAEEGRFPSDIGQTETVVEGHNKYSWANGNADARAQSPPNATQRKTQCQTTT